MDEQYLEDLTRARHRHMLACLHAIGSNELGFLAGLDRMRAAPPDLSSLVRFTGPGAGQSRPAEWLAYPGVPRKGPDARIGAGGTAAQQHGNRSRR
jgi:hypothetical protein